MSEADSRFPASGSSSVGEGRPRVEALQDQGVVHGAHDTYTKGEVSSVGELISDITADLSTLMRQEVALAKAEVKQSATNAGKGAGMLAGAGVAGHFVLLFVSIAAWWGLGSLMGAHGWAALIVAVVWGVIAAVLAAMGRSNLKKVEGVPKTMDTAKKVPDALKGNEN